MLKLTSLIIYGAEFVGEINSVHFTILIFTLPTTTKETATTTTTLRGVIWGSVYVFWYFARSPIVIAVGMLMTFSFLSISTHGWPSR